MPFTRHPGLVHSGIAGVGDVCPHHSRAPTPAPRAWGPHPSLHPDPPHHLPHPHPSPCPAPPAPPAWGPHPSSHPDTPHHLSHPHPSPCPDPPHHLPGVHTPAHALTPSTICLTHTSACTPTPPHHLPGVHTPAPTPTPAPPAWGPRSSADFLQGPQALRALGSERGGPAKLCPGELCSRGKGV